MRLDHLPAQSPINPRADAYALRCLALSRAVEAASAVGTGPRLVAGQPFGPDPWQRLDLWLPRAECNGLPVLLFFHGGNFTHGHKEWCGFMAPAVTGLGAILVSGGYRLAPGASYRAILEDGFAALSWVRAHIAGHGGDPARVFIAGHSAGAQIVAEMALRHDRRAAAGLPDNAIRGVLGISGSYFRRLADQEADPALRVAPEVPDSPLELAAGARHAFHIAWGEAEKPEVRQAGADMVAALRAAGARVGRHAAPGEDHFTMHLNTGDPNDAWIRHLAGWLENPPA